MSDWRAELETRQHEATCTLTTRGRRTGRPHVVTIWFAVDVLGRIYLSTLRLDRDWAKNAIAEPRVTLQVGDLALAGTLRLLDEETAAAEGANVIAQKYWGAWLARWLGLRPEGVFEMLPSDFAT